MRAKRLGRIAPPRARTRTSVKVQQRFAVPELRATGVRMVERTPTHGREGERLDLDLENLRGEISSLSLNCVSPKEEGVGFI